MFRHEKWLSAEVDKVTRTIPALKEPSLLERLRRWAWIAAVAAAATLALLLAKHRQFSALPQESASRELALAFLQAHAALAALTLVFVVLLIQAMQRSEYAEIIWDDFLTRSGIRTVAAFIFASIGVEAVLVLLMTQRSPNSPLPTAAGAGNLFVFVLFGFVGTIAISFWLVYRALDLMRASSLWQLAQDAGRNDVRRSVRRQATERIWRRVFGDWRTQHNVGWQRVDDDTWKPALAAKSGYISDICFSKLERLLLENNNVSLDVERGYFVIAGDDAIGRIRNGTMAQLRILSECIQVSNEP